LPSSSACQLASSATYELLTPAPPQPRSDRVRKTSGRIRLFNISCPVTAIASEPATMIPLVDLQAQYRSIKAEVGLAVARVMENGQFFLGPEVEGFETEFADLCGAIFS